MTQTEALHLPRLTNPHLTDSLRRARQAMGQLRLSHRDHDRSADAISQSLAALGPLEYQDSLILPATETAGPRIEHAATIRRGGHTHQFRITESISRTDGSAEALYCLPGITQDPGIDGAALTVHREIAEAFPAATIVTAHTDGVGSFETKLSLKQNLSRSFEAMAQARLDTGQQLFGERPVTMIGNSMGTVVLTHMLSQNLETAQLNSDTAVYLSPALVTPGHAKRVMGLEFLPDACRASLFEIEGGRLAVAAACVREISKLPSACLGNALQLSHGIEEQTLQTVAAHNRIGIIYGDQDRLAQPELYAALAQNAPQNVHILEKPNRGHWIADYAPEIAADIRAFTRLGSFALAACNP